MEEEWESIFIDAYGDLQWGSGTQTTLIQQEQYEGNQYDPYMIIYNYFKNKGN